MSGNKHDTDLRKYARQTQLRTIIGAVALIYIVGIGLIYLFYDWTGATMGLICLSSALVPVALIVLILQSLDWALRKYKEKQDPESSSLEHRD